MNRSDTVDTAATPVPAPRSRTANGASGVKTRRTSLQIPAALPLAAWTDLGQQIGVVMDSSAWWMGDWLIYGQANFPDRYQAAVEQTNLEYQTLRNYASIARRFHPRRRHPRLSLQHHAEVACLPDEAQDELLCSAESAGWSRNELRRRVKAYRELQSGREVRTDEVQLRVGLDTRQKERWEEAARRAELDLTGWIVEMLDRAAESHLQELEPIGSDVPAGGIS